MLTRRHISLTPARTQEERRLGCRVMERDLREQSTEIEPGTYGMESSVMETCLFVQVVNASDTDSSSSEEDAEERTERRTNPDGTVSTAADRELQIYAYLSKPQQRQMGRWSSRSAKLERIRKQELQQKREPPPPDRPKKRKKFKKGTERSETVSNKRVKE